MDGGRNTNETWRQKAMLLVQEGRTEEALAAFETAIGIDACDAMSWSGKADVLQALGRHGDALTALDEAIQLDPSSAAYWSGKAVVLYELRRLPEALAAVERVIQLSPEDSVAWRRKGAILGQVGRGEDGLAACEKAIRLDSCSSETWCIKGNVLRDLGRHEEAVAAYEEAIRIRPDDADAWSGKRVSLCELGRLKEALMVLIEAVRLDPRSAGTWNNKGCVLCDLGKHDEAIDAWNRAIQLERGFAPSWISKGSMLRKLEQYEDALAAYDEAIQLIPGAVALWEGKGETLSMVERHDEALAAFEEAIRLNSKRASLWYEKGKALYMLCRHEEALTAFETTIELDPTLGAAWCAKGKALRAMSRHEEALMAFDEAIRLDRKDVLSWDGKGSVLCSLARYEEALAASQEAVRLDPNNAPPWTGVGKALAELGRYEEALEAYEKAIRLDPDDISSWSNKGTVLGELGRYDEALSAFAEAIRLEPSCADAWTGRGNALSELARYQEALPAFEEAIRLNPNAANPWNGKGAALEGLGQYEKAVAAIEEAIFLEPRSALSWVNMAAILRAHDNLQRRRADRYAQQCLLRAAYLSQPSHSAQDMRRLRRILLAMAEDGGTGLLVERLVERALPASVSLTIERVLRHTRQETEVAHAVFRWLEDPDCLLGPLDKMRVHGQVLLRFGDPIRAREVLDATDDAPEGERDLGSQLYLVWSLKEYLEPNNEELRFAHMQARRWMRGDWGAPSQMTCYYAGHIALLDDDLNLAQAAFGHAGRHPATLLMSWQVARLSKDKAAAETCLADLLAEERRCLRGGRKGILFPEEPSPFDPNTNEGQQELELVLRRFEVAGAMMDLLETADLRKHPGYQPLANEFQERTSVLDDLERYERAVRTWKVKEEIQRGLEHQQEVAIQEAAEREMYARAKDFAILDVAPPCSLRGDALADHLAQRLFQSDLGGQQERVMNVILSMLRQGRLKPEQSVLLTMYAYAKAHHDEGAARATRVETFGAKTVMEAVLLYLLRNRGIWFVYAAVTAMGRTLPGKLIETVEAIRGRLRLSESESFPTYVEFVEHLHRYWEESPGGEGFRTFLQ